MEPSFPGMLLILAVLFGAHLLALRQIAAAEVPVAPCRLHLWEPTDHGLVCRACGKGPTAD
jgi:hypothetical protein